MYSPLVLVALGLLLAANKCWCQEPPFFESISADGLIGSHFGVAGIDAQYDFVIIGGGTAGLTLAHRLSEDSRFTVAVVDAGDFYEFANGNNSQIPSFASVFTGSDPILRNPYLDWYQFTVPQPVSMHAKLFQLTLYSLYHRVLPDAVICLPRERLWGAAARATSCGTIGKASSSL